MSLSETKAADAHGEEAIARTSVYVYEAPVRIWHWVNAFCILTLALTGYFIGAPLPAVPAERFLLGASVESARLAARAISKSGSISRNTWPR